MDRVPDSEQEPPHDILAAEAFAVPASDGGPHHLPLRLPEDLTGSDEPRDVLAAEEFAMPAPESAISRRAGGRRATGALPAAALALLAMAVLRRRRRRRR